MDDFSALRRKDILIHAATWTNLEDMILNEISQTLKKSTV